MYSLIQYLLATGLPPPARCQPAASRFGPLAGQDQVYLDLPRPLAVAARAGVEAAEVRVLAGVAVVVVGDEGKESGGH